MITGEGKHFELIRCGSTGEWLEVRKHGIGGSDVAALMGLSRYKQPYTLWLEKRGEIEPEDISGKQAVMWGNILEPVVGEHYAELHPDRAVRRVNAVCRSLSRPHAQASLDYEVHDPELGWGVLEIKTAGFRSSDDWADGVPLYYLTQVMHYLSVTGRMFADVAVLIAGQDYREYRVTRDEEDIAAIDSAVDMFWQSVVEGVEPDVNGGDLRALFERYPRAVSDIAEASKEVESLVTLWRNHVENAKRAEAMAKQYAAELEKLIGDCDGYSTKSGRVVWQRGTMKRLDSKRLKAEKPGLFEEYTVEVQRNGGLRFYEDKGEEHG